MPLAAKAPAWQHRAPWPMPGVKGLVVEKLQRFFGDFVEGLTKENLSIQARARARGRRTDGAWRQRWADRAGPRPLPPGLRRVYHAGEPPPPARGLRGAGHPDPHRLRLPEAVPPAAAG